MRNCWSILVAPAVIAAGGQSMAQIAPGLRKPETQLQAMGQALDMGCFLATAGRPVPGINQPLLGMKGEGLTPQEVAADWLSPLIATAGRNQVSLLKTPQGPVWIVFNLDNGDCNVAAKAADRTALLNGLISRFTGEFGKWTTSETSTERTSLRKSIEGSSLEWSAVIVTPEVSADVILVTMSATDHKDK